MKKTISGESGINTYIDLFCGIGGFHQAARSLGLQCVFASDIDEEVRRSYSHNYGIEPYGDITAIPSNEIPAHDLLLAGFPCQPFSIIGSKKGLKDPRGKLYKEIVRIVRDKKPKVIILENVKQLATMQNGAILASIRDDIENLGYHFQHKILDARDFGIPQKRERVIMVATLEERGFCWPKEKGRITTLKQILEKHPDPKYFVSERIKKARQEAHISEYQPGIWHENKSGNISSHPYSCALRSGASYNYLLVDGERRLTPREQLRLQGFPDDFDIVCNDSQTRKQTGNSVPVPMIKAVLGELLDVC